MEAPGLQIMLPSSAPVSLPGKIVPHSAFSDPGSLSACLEEEWLANQPACISAAIWALCIFIPKYS